MVACEYNFDGIVGSTHHYGGLSFGNRASLEHKHLISNPREAALQGLKKMEILHQMGIKQAILPPHERPYLPFLRGIGFSGSNEEILKRVYQESPQLLSIASSSSAMWAANAATVSPSSDSAKGKVQVTPANLSSNMHRAIEADLTREILSRIFSDKRYFSVFSPLQPELYFSDEGAANHTRFCDQYGNRGVELFVYGRSSMEHSLYQQKKYPARQSLEASMAIARRHKIDPEAIVYAQQNPSVIDLGVFHNDVISVGNRDLFFYHERSFVDQPKVIEELCKKFERVSGKELQLIEVSEKEVSVSDAVSSYLFNSQLVSLDNNSMVMVAPSECERNQRVKNYLDRLVEENSHSIKRVIFMDLKQSMRNGGGPACLRLRVVMSEEESQALHQGVVYSASLHEQLKAWIESYYRDRLTVDDLRDVQFLEESYQSLDALCKTLGLDRLYSFQK